MSIVTISRGTLSGGARLARLLAQRLNYEVLSREVIVEAASTYGVSEARLVEAMKVAPGLWARFTGQAQDYVLAVQATLAEMLERGNVVYHGLAGPFLLKGLPGVVKVHVIAPIEQRLQAATAELGLGREQAALHIQELDAQRERWVRKLYHADWRDPSHYDLVLNLGDMSPESAVAAVAGLVQSPEYAWTPDVARLFADFALGTRVRAHLRLRSGFASVPMTVQVRQGVVQISGDADFEARRAEIGAFVRGVPGVKEVLAHGETVMQRRVETRQDKTAAQAMLPLQRFPHVPEWATLREAMAVLRTASSRLEDGRWIAPRHVLVLDQAGHLAGVVSRRDLLRGITPGYQSARSMIQRVQGVVPLRAEQLNLTIAWGSLLSHEAIESARLPVREVMSKPKGVVKTDQPLSSVITSMVEHGLDVVPVLDDQTVVGVVLMTDVFEAVAKYILDQHQEPEGPSEPEA